jgi:hypothetical protein
MAKNQIDIAELEDFKGTLKEFKQIVDKLTLEYGEQSLIYFDAGYNNVDVVIETV